MKKLLKYFNGYKLVSILGPLMKLGETLLELMVPMIVALIIDTGIPSGNRAVVLNYIGLMFLLALFGLLLSITAQYFSAAAAVGFTENMTADLFRHVVKLPKENKDNLTSGSIVTRLTGDTFHIQTGLNIFFRLFLRSPFVVLGSLMMAVLIDTRMTVIFVSMTVLLGIVIWVVTRAVSPLNSLLREQFDYLVTLTQEQMTGMRVIRAFRQREREGQSFQQHNETLTQTQLRAGWINILLNPLTYAIVNLALILVLWQGGTFINSGTLTQGQLVALVNYLLAIIIELVKFAIVIAQFNRAYASAKRLVEIIEQPEVSSELVREKNLHAADDSLIAFNNVSFTYPNANKPSLTELDFTIKEGSFIGIIGSTGSGKSTLLQLITKVYDSTEGDLDYNPAMFDLSSRESLRTNISVVPSEVALFKGTIRSNLLVSYPEATDEMMWQALEDAQAAEFVSKYPDGLDKEVAAFGRNFSGGQRQRLTIARALIRPAQVLIFDDSTSALDYVTEANFQQVLRHKYSDRTIIMISQRTHSLLTADKILVLEEGRQIGFAAHEDLLRNNEVYQAIYQSQTVEEI